ncbi:hypothetical protein HK100_002207 [Physocladia obscura]|uniref:xylan 1,4-beta-xylosidase n=1 Tax=Physocladia obscura TaxID=109957 RepID=A0AAD5SVM1_9FUNG|nr:hypothetical protein HK100_002207 [Physocladia obscura]
MKLTAGKVPAIVIAILAVVFACAVDASKPGAFNNNNSHKQAVFEVSSRIDPCRNALLKTNALCNVSLPLTERASRFVAQLSLEEKVAQMGNNAPSIDRIGLSAYPWWNEALHGVCAHFCIQDNGKEYCATPFPTALAQAASFNMDLVWDIGIAISNEARAVHRFSDGDFGLNVWSPNINIYRDPRWGRGQETPGEDPFLTSMYGVHYVQSLQENVDGYPKLYATLKHYAVYNVEKNRNSFNAVVSTVDLHQTFLPAFKASIEKGKAGSVMCAYNAVNGIPACANNYLMRDLLREKWGFDGFVVSDCDAINDISSNHHYNKTVAEAAATALLAGNDLDCGGSYSKLKDAVIQKLIPESLVDESLTRLVKARLELGIFDPFESQKLNQLPLHTIDSPEHRALARDGARQSLVLLKNSYSSHGGLPLNKIPKSVAVIGPHAATTEGLLGIYLPSRFAPVTTLAQGFRNTFIGADFSTHTGCNNVGCEDGSSLNDAVELAARADLTIVCLGLDKSIEDEGRDRSHIDFPGYQLELLKRATKVSKNPVILVVIAGGSLDLSWAKISDKVGAVLYGFYPGEETANAIADVVLGKHSPAGRLPITFYKSDYINQVDLSAPVMREGPGRTYRFYQDEPLYPFGYGLSYADFSYIVSSSLPKQLTVGKKHWKGESAVAAPRIKFEVIVKNDGKSGFTSDHSVLAFVTMDISQCPLKQLFGFHSLRNVKPGQHKKVEFEWEPVMAFCVNKDGERVTVPGKYTLWIGDKKVHEVEVVFVGGSGNDLELIGQGHGKKADFAAEKLKVQN